MNLTEKLNVIQTKLKAPKGQYNSFGKYNYRSCEDILEGLKPLLEETKTTIRLSDTVESVGNRIYIRATATLSDGENEISTTAYARESETKKGMDDSQVTGTASSYARKYALNGLLAIDDTKDADTMDNTKNPTAAQQSQKAPAQKPHAELKGGDATPEEKKRINEILGSRYENGTSIFTTEEIRAYSDKRKTEYTAAELIAVLEKVLSNRKPKPVQNTQPEIF